LLTHLRGNRGCEHGEDIRRPCLLHGVLQLHLARPHSHKLDVELRLPVQRPVLVEVDHPGCRDRLAQRAPARIRPLCVPLPVGISVVDIGPSVPASAQGVRT
jgi:hypothetical protein